MLRGHMRAVIARNPAKRLSFDVEAAARIASKNSVPAALVRGVLGPDGAGPRENPESLWSFARPGSLPLAFERCRNGA